MPPRLNIPPVTRILLIVLGVQSILSAAIRYRQWSGDSQIVIPYLTLIPQLSLVYPWTFLTSTLVENNIFTLAIAGLTIFHGGRYLERAWSSAEFAKFLLVASLIPNTITFIVLILFFSMTRDERWGYVLSSSFTALSNVSGPPSHHENLADQGVPSAPSKDSPSSPAPSRSRSRSSSPSASWCPRTR